MGPTLPDPALHPPRPAEELLAGVLDRGRALARRRRRRRLAARAGPVAVALLVAVSAFVVRHQGGPSDDLVDTRPERVEILEPPDGGAPPPEVGPTPEVPGPGGPPGTAPPTSSQRGGELGAGTGPGPSGGSGPGSGAPAPRRTTVAFDQPVDGGWRSAVLLPGADEVRGLTARTADQQWPSLSPDGRQLVFQSDQANLLAGVKTNWELFTIGVDGRDERRVTVTPVDAGYGNSFPAWSPTGGRIVHGCVEPAGGLCTVRPDGSGRATLAAPGHALFAPRWSPDGRRLVALSDGASGGERLPELWVVDADGGERRLASGRVFGAQQGVAWTADGGRVVVASADGDHVRGAPLVTIDVVTDEVRPLAGFPKVLWLADCRAGRVVVRLAEEFGPGRRGDWITVDLDGSRPEVLLQGERHAGLRARGCTLTR